MNSELFINKKLIGILAVIFALLVVGSFTMKTFVASGAVNALSWLVMLVILFKFFNKQVDAQTITVMLLFLSFYNYSSEKGGVWNYAFFLFTGLLVSEKRIKIGRDKTFRAFSIFLAALVILGIFYVNPSGMGDKISYAVVFLSFVLFFSIAKSIVFNISFFKLFTAIVLVIAVMQFVICVNQRFEITHVNLPFFPTQELNDEPDNDLREEGLDTNKVRNWGSVGDFEAFGEVNAMLFIFYFTFLVREGKTVRKLKLLTPIRLILVFTVLCVLLSGTRSSLLMAGGFVFLIYLFNLKKLLNWKFFSGLALLLLLFLVSFNFIYTKLGLDTLATRMNILAESNVDVSTGEGINRKGPYDMGFEALNSSSHMIGNGYAFGKDYQYINNSGSNSIAFMDAHNLYLTLPLYFGWIGSVIILLLLIYPVYKGSRIKGMLGLPFALMWLSFLLNQFKIVFIRHPNYESLIFVLLGLTYAYCNGSKMFDDEVRLLN